MDKIMQKLALVFTIGLLAASATAAESIGTIKTLSGEVTIERAGQRKLAKAGESVFQSDRIITGEDGAVGLIFEDDSRISAGPGSTLHLDSFKFDRTTHDGNLDVSMQKGTLSVISGKLTQKTPGALKVRTPAAILAVRGTEFSVRVEDVDGPEMPE
jgi:hypothetical protein